MAPQELTLRAALAGVGIGAVLGIGNVYLGLKTGFFDPGTINAAILGFVLLAPLARRGALPFLAPENNVLATVAASTAVMPSVMGLLGAVPALAMLGQVPSLATLIAWAVALGVAGVLFAIPLRPLFIDRENLPFPTARATAEVIAATHAHALAARQRARALAVGALAALAITWLRDAPPRWIPAALVLPGALATLSPAAPLAVALSPLLLGSGVLVGLRTCGELLLGGLVAWVVLGPLVVQRGLATADFDSLSAWLLWPGVALMLAGGLTALALGWRTFASLGRDLAAFGRGRWRRTALVALASAGAVLVIGVVGLGLPPLMGVVAIVITVPLVSVLTRAAGQTDMANFAALGQTAQATLAAVTPSSAAPNVVGGSIISGSAPQTLMMSMSFKVASIVGGRTAPLVWAQLLGVVAGALVSAPAYALLVRAHGVGTPELPAPWSATWHAMGLLAGEGLSALPPGVTLAAGVAFVVGVAGTLAHKTRLGRSLPSPLTVGVAFMVPPAIVITIALGGAAAALLAWRAPGFSERNLAPAAAGAIAGESLVGVTVALLVVLGVLPK